MAMIKKSMAGIDGLGSLSNLNGTISNRSSIVDAINAVHTVAQTAAAGFKFYTVEDKTTNVTASVGDQVHVTNDGDAGWAVYRVTTDINNATLAASSSSIEKLMDMNSLWNEFTASQITEIGQILANVTVTQSIDLDALAAAVTLNTAKVSNVTTDLSATRTATTITVVSSDGTDAVLAAASGTDAGVMSAADKTKLDGIAAGAQVNTVDSVAGKTGVVALIKGDVGLGNVDNTSDADKPVSTAQQSALDLKAPINNPTFTGTVSGVTKAMVGLGNVENTALSTWAGTSNITTVGTITVGTWNGDAIGNAYITQSSVTQHQAALTITTSQVSNLSITTNSVSDGTNTFTGKSYTIVTESLTVNGSGQITLTGEPVGGSLLNFNTVRHTSGGISADYTVTNVFGNTFDVDVSLDGQAVTAQYLKLV